MFWNKLNSIWIFRRYASGRNHYVKGGSVPSKDILTPEVKDLLRNKKNFDNFEKKKPMFERETLPKAETLDKDYQQICSKIVYYDSGKEELDGVVKSADYSPVFLVSRVKTLHGEPYWHKRTCESLGLGRFAAQSKVVALPNLPSFAKKLYSVKHLIKIVPVRFPENFDPSSLEPSHCKVDLNTGVFQIFKEIVNPEVHYQVPEKALITKTMLKEEARTHWEKPRNSMLGNHNYHRDTTHAHPEKSNWISDSAFKVYDKILNDKIK